MKDNYGQELKVGSKVVINVGGVLHKGTIHELKDKGKFPVRVMVLQPYNYKWKHCKMHTGHISKTTSEGVVVI